MCVCNYSGLGHRSSEFGGNPDLHLSTCSYEISLILPRVLSLCSCRRPLLSCCPAATGRTEKPITNYHLPFTSYRFYLATCKTVSAQSSTQETVHRWHLSFEKLMIQAASGIWCSSINHICVYSSSSTQVSQVLTWVVSKKRRGKIKDLFCYSEDKVPWSFGMISGTHSYSRSQDESTVCSHPVDKQLIIFTPILLLHITIQIHGRCNSAALLCFLLHIISKYACLVALFPSFGAKEH